jgi:hypothetical protein
MKKVILITILLVAALCLMAQATKAEVTQSLDTAKSMVMQENYTKAQEEINFALSKISEILSEKLVLYIPDAPAGYAQSEKNAQGLGAMGGFMGSSNAIAATARYSTPTTEDENYENDSSLNLTITVGGLLGKTAGFAALGNMFGGGGTGSKTIRIKGYNSTLEFSAENKSGKLTVQVGDKISVLVEGNNIASADIMKTLAEKIDLAKLEKAF